MKRMIMDSELENKTQEQFGEQLQSNREGYKPAGYYQKDYRAGGRPQRPRIHTQRAYTSSHSEQSEEGGFRPEGFGAGLQSGNTTPQRPYRPRFNNNMEGGYQQRGGYQPRQQGGYRPKFNNAEGQEGYQPRPQGGYRPRQ